MSRAGIAMPAGRLAFLVWAYVIGAAALLVGLTLTVPVEPGIALPFSVGGIDPVVLGIALWIGVGITTGTRAASDEGHAAVVYAVPAVVAAFALGGPTAAAWVALLGSTELRELRGGLPWYGVLANHAMVVVPGAMGGPRDPCAPRRRRIHDRRPGVRVGDGRRPRVLFAEPRDGARGRARPDRTRARRVAGGTS
jgi:hypothetical protein